MGWGVPGEDSGHPNSPGGVVAAGGLCCWWRILRTAPPGPRRPHSTHLAASEDVDQGRVDLTGDPRSRGQLEDA